MSRRVSIPHVPGLDGLRGAAVAGVLLFHAGHLTGGYLGVDLFFVLSGFLITSLLLTESGSTGRIALGGFWARRARRLLPALVLVLLGVAVYCLVFADASELDRIRGDALATVAYVANWRSVLSGQDYWALFLEPSPLEHTWSLAIEEQFYLVWPLVFVGLLAWWKSAVARAVLVTSLVLAGVSAALMYVLYSPDDVSRAYYGTDTRASGILLGAALAAALAIWGPVRGRAARIGVEVAGLAGIAVLAVAWTGLDGQDSTLYRGGFLLCGVAAIAVIAAVMHPDRGVITRALSFRPLCLLGLISYGVYLWHWPVDIVLDATRTGIDGWPLFFLQFAVTLAIATASYVLVEMPIRRGAFTPTQWAVAIPATAVALVVAIVLTTTGGTDSSFASSSATQTRGSARFQVLVVGDSVAGSLSTGIIDAGFHTAVRTVPGCSIFRRNTSLLAIPDVDCRWRKLWQDQVRDLNPRVVFLALGAFDLFDVNRRSGDVAPGEPIWDRAYVQRMQRAINVLGAQGATVVLPTIPCFVRRSDKFADVPDARSPFNIARVQHANALRRQLEAPPGGLVTPDLYAHVCAGDRFHETLPGMQRGADGRPDGVHFSSDAARVVGEWLTPVLSARAGQPLAAARRS